MSDVYKFRLGIVADVVVAKELISWQEICQLVSLLVQILLVEMVTNTNCSTEDEIHLKYFCLFVVDYTLLFFVNEFSRLQTKGNIVQELAVLVLLWIKEEAEVVEDVIEEIIDNNCFLD